jgi:hypothetical protein
MGVCNTQRIGCSGKKYSVGSKLLEHFLTCIFYLEITPLVFRGKLLKLVVNLQVKVKPVLDTFSGCCQQTFGAPR